MPETVLSCSRGSQLRNHLGGKEERKKEERKAKSETDTQRGCGSGREEHIFPKTDFVEIGKLPQVTAGGFYYHIGDGRCSGLEFRNNSYKENQNEVPYSSAEDRGMRILEGSAQVRLQGLGRGPGRGKGERLWEPSPCR